VEVFLLYHVAHAVIDGVSARHRSDEGDLLIDEQAGDEVFLLGCYSTAERVQDRIERARALPGFGDEPDCFMVSKYELDRDEWPQGFISVPDYHADRASFRGPLPHVYASPAVGVNARTCRSERDKEVPALPAVGLAGGQARR
jgi:hypothetical protein